MASPGELGCPEGCVLPHVPWLRGPWLKSHLLHTVLYPEFPCINRKGPSVIFRIISWVGDAAQLREDAVQ